MRQFLLQMAGESGAGKSTLALAVGRACGAVVLDKDIVVARLREEGVPPEQAGGLSYAVLFPQAESLLRQGFSVVFDSPAFWESITQRGQRIAREAGATYRLIECTCPDFAEQEARLQARPRLVSQPASRVEVAVSLSRPGVKLALAEPHLTVDTTRPLEDCVADVLEYLRS